MGSSKKSASAPSTNRKSSNNKNSKIIAKPAENEATITISATTETTSGQDAAAVTAAKPNIILHLKCYMKDLCSHENKINTEYKYNPEVPPEIVAYSKPDTQYSFLQEDQPATMASAAPPAPQEDNINSGAAGAGVAQPDIIAAAAAPAISEENMMTHINAKLKKLKVALFKNSMDEKKSACFWCTYDFENQPCYIPKYETDSSIHAYGSFCCPECAAAFLFEENIDDSVKFERFHLMNQVYGGIYGYQKNIQLAPNPYYTLSKYYGNLSIEEYRALSQTDRIFIVIDRPLTRVLPELHEEKDKAVAGSGTGIYRVKRQSDMTNRPSKNAILREVFGVA
jgi:hypothetical protein